MRGMSHPRESDPLYPYNLIAWGCLFGMPAVYFGEFLFRWLNSPAVGLRMPDTIEWWFGLLFGCIGGIVGGTVWKWRNKHPPANPDAP